MTASPALDPAALPWLAGASRLSQAIYVVAKLRIADHPAGEAKGLRRLARLITDIHAPTLRRLMRALASEGVFTEDDSGQFGPWPHKSWTRLHSGEYTPLQLFEV